MWADGNNMTFHSHRLLHWLALCGKWSMVDVFLVAILLAVGTLRGIAAVEVHCGTGEGGLADEYGEGQEVHSCYGEPYGVALVEHSGIDISVKPLIMMCAKEMAHSTGYGVRGLSPCHRHLIRVSQILRNCGGKPMRLPVKRMLTRLHRLSSSENLRRSKVTTVSRITEPSVRRNCRRQ
jgi:hypothetical protein